MSLNLSTIKPLSTQSVGGLQVNNPSDNNLSRSQLGVSNHLRMETFKANGNTWQQPQNTGEYLKTNPTDNPIETAGKQTANMVANTAVGAGKAAIKGTVGVASGLQSLGKGILGGISRVFGGSGDTSKLGVKALDPSTPEGQAVQTKLNPSNTQQNVAGYGEIAGELVPGAVEGIPKLANLYKSIVEKATTGKVLTTEERTLQGVVDAVSPKMTPTETSEAIAEGRGKPSTTFSKAKVNPTPRTLEVADATKDIINPGGSNIENANNVRTALKTEAESFRNQIQAVDHAVPFKEVEAKLSNIKEPISIRGTQFEKQTGAIKDAVMEMLRKGKGTVEGVFDARQGLDDLVAKEYPNLYDKDYSPMRSYVKAIRDEMGNIIENNLPDDVSYKDSMKKQSLFYDAIDTLSEKGRDELGRSGLQKTVNTFIKKHPVISGAVGLGVGERVVKKVEDLTGL